MVKAQEFRFPLFVRGGNSVGSFLRSFGQGIRRALKIFAFNRSGTFFARNIPGWQASGFS
jgi:hypothetical protein